MRKTLVAYFSASGVTAGAAKTVAKAASADLFEIKPQTLYTKGDLNWTDQKSRSSLEMNDKSARPAIADTVRDIDRYDTVLIGFPIWWYTAPRIIETFLESYDFSGKQIAIFATSGGSGLGNTEKDLQAACKSSVKWLKGRLLSGRVNEAEVAKWLQDIGL